MVIYGGRPREDKEKMATKEVTKETSEWNQPCPTLNLDFLLLGKERDFCC